MPMDHQESCGGTSTCEALPIEAFKADILACEARYFIVEAETGSGKSTQIARWLCNALGERVLVTEPLVETVIGTAEYVAQLEGCAIGTKVGYRTGDAHNDSPETRILYCTDTLALVRELGGQNRFDVLLIDEAHMWNTAQSTLEAWVWMHLCAGDLPFKKVIILSATMDAGKLSRKRGDAPVFRVPGRQFPITDLAAGIDLLADVRTMTDQGHDVLVFLPGEKEIRDLKEDIAEANLNVETVPFYGRLARAEKDRAYQAYARPKVILSTNALETGRTILPSPGRQLAVIDSGEERLLMAVDGVDGLYKRPISRAQSQQRRGRTGRVGPGIYIDHCFSEGRDDFPIPEIKRTALDRTVLRLAVAGYDARVLPFFHDLDHDVIDEAHRTLQLLGAMTADGQVTPIGYKMERLPVSLSGARMLVEAQRLGVVREIATIVAIIESKTLIAREDEQGLPSKAWKRLCREEKTSDALALLDVFEAAGRMAPVEMRRHCIHVETFQRVLELRNKILERMDRRRDGQLAGDRRTAIKKAVCAGMLHRVFCWKDEAYRNGDSAARKLCSDSVVDFWATLIVGVPWDLEYDGHFGDRRVHRLINTATIIDPRWLMELAPHLVRREMGINPRYCPTRDCVVSTTRIHFQGRPVGEIEDFDPHHPDAASLFAAWVTEGMLPA